MDWVLDNIISFVSILEVMLFCFCRRNVLILKIHMPNYFRVKCHDVHKFSQMALKKIVPQQETNTEKCSLLIQQNTT